MNATLVTPELYRLRNRGGLIVPTNWSPGNKSNSWLVIDCADDRPHTEESAARRLNSVGSMHSEGHFGGYIGLEVVKALHDVAMIGVTITQKHLINFGEHYFPTVTAINAAKLRKFNVVANTHSDWENEKNGTKLNLSSSTPNLGCAFVNNLPTIVESMTDKRTIDEAKQLAAFLHIDSQDISDSADNAKGLHLAIEKAPISKAVLSKEFSNMRAPEPVILQGKHALAEKAKVYLTERRVSTHKWKHWCTEQPRYTHNVSLPETVLPFAYPGNKFDHSALAASSLLIAVATTRILRQEKEGLGYELITSETLRD